MCTQTCLDFIERSVVSDDVTGKKVLEVGSYDVNGSPRTYLTSLAPSEYLGIDIMKGPGVDVICHAEQLVERFGPATWDVVITTEMIEHVRDWRTVIANLKTVTRPGGTILLTTRSRGFEMHGFPYDFWRFELDDMRAIFSDCQPVTVESDPYQPGVFVKAIRGERAPLDLSGVGLYNVIRHRRSWQISPVEVGALRASWAAFRVVKDHAPGVARSLRAATNRYRQT